ncbi:MAG: helix-turn-helix domain-containing protein [Actinomycetota bacterium]
MRYRVEQLAAACDVSVDTVRYYQSRGLLPQPEREGRVAWYGDEHEARIREIRTLQAKGLTLAAIRRVVTGELGPADADLAAAVAAARGESGDETELLDLDAFAARSGVPASLIQAVEREGIRLGRVVDGEDRYTAGDIELVRTALRLLEFGLPLPDLLGLARDADTAMRGLAERAVELFDEHVRKPIRDTAGDDDVAATQMVEAFGELLPAVTQLISYHFRRVLLETAEEHIEEATG